jgi:thioesterase domain-containing protein
VWQGFIQAGLVAQDTELDAFSMFLEVHRRQMRSLRNYSGGTIRGPTVLFRSAEPVATGVMQAEGTSALSDDMGWAERTTGRFAIEFVPGTHQTMITAPHVATLAARLAARVREVLAAGATD